MAQSRKQEQPAEEKVKPPRRRTRGGGEKKHGLVAKVATGGGGGLGAWLALRIARDNLTIDSRIVEFVVFAASVVGAWKTKQLVRWGFAGSAIVSLIVLLLDQYQQSRDANKVIKREYQSTDESGFVTEYTDGTWVSTTGDSGTAADLPAGPAEAPEPSNELMTSLRKRVAELPGASPATDFAFDMNANRHGVSA